MNITVTRQDTTTPDALHHHYTGETAPQPCFLALNLEDGELAADWDGEIGNGVPESVWSGRTLRWTIPILTTTAANDLLAEAAPIAQRVLNGAAIDWDGSNHRGTLNEAAEAAHEEITALIATYDDQSLCVVEWDAADFFTSDADAISYGITATSSDADLDTLAAKARNDAATCDPGVGHIVLYGVEQYFRTLRNELRDELAEDAE